VLTYILGAPGSGKTALVEPLRKLLPGHVVIDWDMFMDPASELAGADIRTTRETWPAYKALVRCAVEGLASLPPGQVV
jgi:uridine kinase